MDGISYRVSGAGPFLRRDPTPGRAPDRSGTRPTSVAEALIPAPEVLIRLKLESARLRYRAQLLASMARADGGGFHGMR